MPRRPGCALGSLRQRRTRRPLGKLRQAAAAFYGSGSGGGGPSANPFIAAIQARSAHKPVAVWPEHWSTFELFVRLQTQWRVGPVGYTGLDYCALYPLLDRQAATPAQWIDLLDDIRAMESAVLDHLAQERERHGGP